MRSNPVLNKRKVDDEIPVSIATANALRGLTGTLLDKPNPNTPPIKNYDEVWFNVRTLFRNIRGAMTGGDGNTLPDDYAIVLHEEMTIIRSYLQQHGDKQAVFYALSYKSFPKLFPKALLKELSTDKQKEYAVMETNSVKALLSLVSMTGEKVWDGDTTLRGNKKNTILLSHYPLDLLLMQGANNLALLESHTGVIKERSSWNTKFYGNSDALMRIPFDRMTIQIFGDSGGMLKPYPKDYQQFLLQLASAEKYKWNSLTTKDRILQCVSLARNPTYEAVIRSMY